MLGASAIAHLVDAQLGRRRDVDEVADGRPEAGTGPLRFSRAGCPFGQDLGETDGEGRRGILHEARVNISDRVINLDLLDFGPVP